jgi:pentatricopeptide repeat protein
MENPGAAETILKKSSRIVQESVYSWNLLIKYYAKSGNISQTERIYQQVYVPLTLGILIG